MNVKQRQIFLKHYYGFYKSKADGINGAKTKSAIKAFQKKAGIPSDGIWGEKTQNKAKSIVKAIQKRLNKVGFACPNNGITENETIKAIKLFFK